LLKVWSPAWRSDCLSASLSFLSLGSSSSKILMQSSRLAWWHFCQLSTTYITVVL
jgi:hypothetical protein